MTILADVAKSICPTRNSYRIVETRSGQSPILFTPNSDWITYRTTVSTSDSDSEGNPMPTTADDMIAASKAGLAYYEKTLPFTSS